jgi:Zn-dependent protease
MDIDAVFLRNGLITFLLLVISLSIHEWAHAIVADWLGDDTPRLQGRVTLNPMSHIDLIGTVIIPLINIFVFRGSFALIGWGRPVMTNPSNFKRRRLDDILVSLAGPASNLLLALLTVVIAALANVHQPELGEFLSRLVMMNIALAVFNLLPIPPLDGSYVLRHLVGMSEETFYGLARWSGLVMLILINVDACRRAIGLMILYAALPYAYLCEWMNPKALIVLFPFLVG